MIFDEWWSEQSHRPRDSRGAAGDAWDQAVLLSMRGLADLMLRNELSTGHGDTFDDLLDELEWQIKELRSPAVLQLLRERDALTGG